MQFSSVAALIIIVAAAATDAARSSRSYSSYRSYRYSGYYRGPTYSRRLSPSLMGALYFSYVTRYPAHFSYRRSVGSSDGSCSNYMALDNGSYIGTFSCPFLPDEPSGWTRCCGYEAEEFCCDPSYDDSWKYNKGLSILAIALIIGGCLTVVGIIGFVVYYFTKRFVTRRTTVVSTAAVMRPHSSAAVAQPMGGPTKLPDYGSKWQQPPPYPTMDPAGVPSPAAIGGSAAVNQGFEPTPYPLYPPPYGSSIGGAAAPH